MRINRLMLFMLLLGYCHIGCGQEQVLVDTLFRFISVRVIRFWNLIIGTTQNVWLLSWTVFGPCRGVPRVV